MLRLSGGALGVAFLIGLGSSAALGQAAGCADGQKLMEQRAAMIQGLSNNGKKKMTPVQACGKFNALVANGQKVLAWIEQNGAWCNVPDAVGARVKDDHQQSLTIRGQACTAATKQRQMEAQAMRNARQQQGAPGGFGGNGGDLVSGQMRVPAGAL